MLNLDYGSSSIFKLLPSFYRDYKDRPFLETIYSGYLRLADADYADLFTDDDNKDLSTLHPTRFQPLAYQKFEDWEVLQAKHSHTHFVEDWPQNTTTIEFRFPGVALGPTNLAFADKAFLPSFLYRLKETWWVTGGVVHRGTLMTLDSRKLSDYFVNSRPSQGTSYSVSSADINFQKLRLTSFDAREIFVESSEDNVVSYTFEKEYDLDTADFYVEFFDIFRSATISYDNGAATIEIPPELATGAKGLVTFSSGRSKDIRILPSFTVQVDNTTVTGLSQEINFDLRGGVSVSGSEVTLNSGVFVPGSTVTVRSGGRTTNTDITSTTNRVSANCDANGSNEVLYLGTNISNFQVQSEVLLVDSCGVPEEVDQRVTFDRPLRAGSTFKVLVAKDSPHSHSTAQAVSTGSSGQFIELVNAIEGSLLVFADGALLYPQDDYTFENSSAMRMVTTLPAGTAIQVVYEASPEIRHSHRSQRFVLDTAKPVREIPLNVENTGHQVLVIKDSTLLDPDQFGAGKDSVVLAEDVSPTTHYQIVHTTYGRQFRHLIPFITESEWNYKARLLSAEALSDGIEKSTVSLDTNQFELVDDGSLYVYTDVKFTEGWWSNAYFDERNLQNTWGSLLGIEGSSTATFARVISAIVGAARSPSSRDTIENFGSILLGSNFTSSAGFPAGLTTLNGVTSLGVNTIDPALPDYSLEVSNCSPLRTDLSGCLPRFFAINRLVEVVDLSEMLPPWFGLALEDLSSSFKAATHLDEYEVRRINSIPFSYDSKTGILTDYSIDFKKLNITRGDLVKVRFGLGSSSGTLSTSSKIEFTRVDEVVSQNQIRTKIQLLNLGTGYGEGAYGEGGYGGNVDEVSFVAKYTVWARAKTRLDTGYLLDTIDPGSLKLINKAIGAFNFGVKVDWSAMTNTEAVEALGVMLDKVRPADTNFITYTEAFSDSCSSPLNEVFRYGAIDEPPSLQGLPNQFYVGESFIGKEGLTVRTPETEALYDPECATFGTLVRATIDTEDRLGVEGLYYISNETMANPSLSQTYSIERGLENTLLRVTSSGADGFAFTAQSNLGARPAVGLKLENGAYIQISPTSSTGNAQPQSEVFKYSSGMDFTVNFWLDFNNTSHLPTDFPTLLDWGPIVIDLDSGAGFYTPRASVVGAQISSNVSIVVDTTNLVTVTYSQVEGQEYRRAKLYVNGVLAAETSSTSIAGTLLSSFTDIAYIGRNAAGDSTAELNSTLLVFDLRRYAMTETDVLAHYNGGVGEFPPVGSDSTSQPLSYPNAWVTYQFHSYWPDPLVPDYSGNAFNATFFGTPATATGTLRTRQAHIGDCHIITSYETIDGKVSSVPKSSVFNPEIHYQADGIFDPTGSVYGGSAELDSNLLTLSRESTSITLPNIAYCLDSRGIWNRFLPDVICATSSFGIDDSDLYLGFGAAVTTLPSLFTVDTSLTLTDSIALTTDKTII